MTTLELTPEAVQEIIKDCLPQDGELTQAQAADLTAGKPVDGYVAARGAVMGFAFIKAAIDKNRKKIADLLAQLPDPFFAGKGGGWSFLNACETRDGFQWGEHRSIDELVCLGIAAGFVIFPLPREMWAMLPGGVPYICVDLKDAA